MDDSTPDRTARWPLIGQSVLAGTALGVLAMVGGGVFLRDAEGLATASAGLVVTVIGALAVGLWAGAPAAEAPEPPLRARWFATGLFVGAAGIFATLWDVLPVVRQEVLAQSLALLLLVAAPIYTLGLLLPSLLSWAEQWAEVWAGDEEPGRWEPLGTVVVSLLAGTVLGVGLAALLLLPYLGAGPALLATGAALIVPTLLPEPTPPETDEEVIYDAETPIGSIRVVEITYPGQRQPERRLYVNGEEESGELVRTGAPTLAYIAAAEKWFAETARRGDRYLFLGGGAYTLPRRVAEWDPKAQITVVELDPEVTRVAHRFFGMRRGYGIGSVHGDARAYLERAEASRFDQIFVDVYGGQESLPYSLVTRESFGLLARALRSGGMLTMNAIGVTEAEGALRFWSLVRTVASVFPSVAIYTHLGRAFPERQNVMIAASLDPAQAFPHRAGLFDRWPNDEWPDLPGVAVLRDLLPVEPAATEARQPVDRATGS